MRNQPSLATAVLILSACSACSGGEGIQGASSAFDPPSAGSDIASVPREAILRDLSLTLRQPSGDGFEVDRNPRFEVVLANGSKTASYPVVLPSDGSEPGWREPHAWYTLEQRTAPSAPWTVPKMKQFGRCGNYDEDWTKDVITLGPGERKVLPWFDFYDFWKLDGITDVRIVAHYAYGEKPQKDVPPALQGMPAYTLDSNALEMPVLEPLGLELTLKGALPKTGARFSDSLEVVATNRSTKVLPFDTGGGEAYLRIEVEGDGPDGSEVVALESGVSVGDAKGNIAPGERKDALGNATVSDHSGLPAGFHARRARAVLHVWWYTKGPESPSDERVARSPWVPVR
jgi:hypothetical protein